MGLSIIAYKVNGRMQVDMTVSVWVFVFILGFHESVVTGGNKVTERAGVTGVLWN